MTVTYQSENQLQLVIDWTKISRSKHITGHISINYTAATMMTYNYQIPLMGHLVKGEISYDTTLTHFLVQDDDKSSMSFDLRTFRLRNNYSLPLLVTNVTVTENFSQNFRLFRILQAVVIPPELEIDIFDIGLTNATAASATIYVYTNVSVYEVPVHCFNGRLQRIVPLEVSQYDVRNAVDEGEINFGILPVSVLHHAMIAFRNPNPVPVKVTSFKARTQAGSIYVVVKGCGDLVTDPLYFCDEIQPKQWIIFGIDVMAPTVGTYSGKFHIKTEIGGKMLEEIITPIKFTTAMGRLELNKEFLHFTDCYPVS